MLKPEKESQKSPVESLLTKWSDAKKRAAINLDELPSAVRGGWVGAKRAAADEVDGLTGQIVRATFPSRLAAAFLDEATDEATESVFGDEVVAGGGVVVDARALYRKFVQDSQFPAASRGKDSLGWSVDDFMRLLHAVEDFCGSDVSAPNLEYIPPPCEDLSPEQAFAHVKRTIEQACGSDLVVVAARRRIFEEVMERRLANSTVPVLVIGADDRTMRSLEPLFRKKARVTVPSDFGGDPEEVQSVLSTVIS